MLRRIQVTAILAGVIVPAVAAADEADSQFAVAGGHYARQRWDLAAEEFERFLADFPDHAKVAEGAFFCGEARLQSGRSADAAARFRQYLALQPHGKLARPARFRAGEAAYLAGQADAAKADLERFLADYPDDELDAYVLPYLGDIALGQDDVAAAARYFRDGMTRFPSGRLLDDCRFGLARTLERRRQNDQAERLYRLVAAHTASPLADDARFHLGALQYGAGKYGEAIQTFAAFETELAKSRWQANARLGRGWALLKLNRLEEATAVFQSIAADANVGIEARYWLGLTHKAREDWAAAAKTLLEAVAAAGPQHKLAAALRFHAGEAQLRGSDPAAAIEQFDLVLGMPGGDNEWTDEAARGKVQAALEATDHEAVDRHAGGFRRRCPESPLGADVNRMQARSLLERKQYRPVVELLEAAIDATRLNRQGTEDRYLLARAYHGLGRHDDALAVLLPVLDVAEGSLKADAQLTQGSILLATKRYGEAMASLEAYLASGPSGDGAVQARGELAVCYARCEQLDKAKRLFAELLDQHADHDLIGPTTEQLAEAAYAAGDAVWAAELFRKLAGHGASAEAEVKGLAGLGWSQFKAGNLTEAQQTFAKLLMKDPPAAVAVEAALLRGRILEQLGQDDPALAMYDLIVSKYRDTPQYPQALLAAATLRDRLQQDEEAARLYEQLTQEYPELPESDLVLYQWAWAMRDLGKPDESIGLLSKLHDRFPRSRYWPDATFRLARWAYVAKDYAEAEKLVAGVLKSEAEAVIRERAAYLQGQIAVARQDWPQVRTVFDAFLKDFPDSPRRLVAEYWVAETIYRQGDYEAAGGRFERLAQRTAGQREPWMAMILLRQAQVLAQQKKWQDAYAIASRIEAEFPGFEQQYEVDYLLGRCLAGQADFERARQAYRKVIASPQGAKTETAAMAQWMIGETFFHQKNYAEALRQYLRLEILYAYPAWQAAALLQAGKCRELLGEGEKAAEIYGRILSVYPNTPFAERARLRLNSSEGQRGDTAGKIDSPRTSPSHEED